MRIETRIVVGVAEVEGWISENFLGLPYSSLVADLGEYDESWHRDYLQSVTVAMPDRYDRYDVARHETNLTSVRAWSKICYEWELASVLAELAIRGRIPFGEYIIEVMEKE